MANRIFHKRLKCQDELREFPRSPCVAVFLFIFFRVTDNRKYQQRTVNNTTDNEKKNIIQNGHYLFNNITFKSLALIIIAFDPVLFSPFREPLLKLITFRVLLKRDSKLIFINVARDIIFISSNI